MPSLDECPNDDFYSGLLVLAITWILEATINHKKEWIFDRVFMITYAVQI